MQKETHLRTIVKTISWRTAATAVTFCVAFILTGTFETAAKIGLLDTFIKLLTYYLHERFWNRINFGRKPAPEYQI